MITVLRTKVKNAAVLFVKTLEAMDEFDLCLFISLSIYNAAHIGSYFGRQYPELGLGFKALCKSMLSLMREKMSV